VGVAPLVSVFVANPTVPDLAALEAEILPAITERFGLRWVSLFLYDQRRERVYLRAAYGDQRVWSPQRLALHVPPPTPLRQIPIWPDLQTTQHPILITEVAHDPRVLYRERLLADEIRSILFVPLLHVETLVGFLSLHHTASRDYTPNDLNWLMPQAQRLAQSLPSL
jgi:GAF domain-containing protein